MADQSAVRDADALPFSRWWLVVVGALAMGAAGTYQFVWSSIRGPLGAQVGASEATLGTLFTLLIVAQTLSQFPAGWVRDRYGPRPPLAAGGVLIAAGYGLFAVAATPTVAAVAVFVGGSGAGTAYTVAVNTPVKWFDERRGLATGIVTMTFSGLSVALIPAIRGGVAGTFRTSLLVIGGGLAAVCLVAAVVVRDPERRSAASDDGDGPIDAEAPQYGWRDAIRTWQFWVLYVVFATLNGVGLMLVEKSIAFADSLGLPAAAATAAASVIALGDSGGVIVGGGLSDRFAPTRTVGGALLLAAAAIVGAVVVGSRGFGAAFVVLAGLAAFFRSPAFAVFPGLVGEYYGTAHSSENYALLYTGKLWGSVFGGAVTSVLIASLGWNRSFLLGAALLVVAGVAMFGVRPVER
jgi:OFA family oxalate/formate antiporter-like MFS transporter